MFKYVMLRVTMGLSTKFPLLLENKLPKIPLMLSNMHLMINLMNMFL